jgi:tetratricopeptide (TPR) repeat protein
MAFGVTKKVNIMVPLSKKQSHAWELIASFVFGVTFLTVMLVIAIYFPKPTEYQMYVFRIVISIAVSGIGAVVPGFLVVHISRYIRAGGALALFVIVYMINPAALVVSEYTPFSDSIRRAETNVSDQNYTSAITFFEQAKQTKPESWIPYYGLGRIYYKKGQYALALENFKKAFNLQGETDGALAYAISINQDAMGNYEEALKSLDTAEKLQHDSPLKDDIVYDKGLINLILWFNQNAPKDSQYYRNADFYFRNFLDRRGSPSQWAYYHLACLAVTRAQDTSLTAGEKAKFRASAISSLERAVNELVNYQSDKAPHQRQTMRTLLTQPATWVRKAGSPVSCPALIKNWTNTHGSINSLVAALN